MIVVVFRRRYIIDCFYRFLYISLNLFHNTTKQPSSETQGQIKGARECLNGRKNIYGTKKNKERREEPLGTMSYQTSFKQSPPFWLLIVARKLVFFRHQSEARKAATIWNWSGKTLSPGAFSSRRSLLFFVPYFPARLDFSSSPLSAPRSPRMQNNGTQISLGLGLEIMIMM